VQFRGYSEKLPVLAKKVFEAIADNQVSDDRFKIFKQNVRNSKLSLLTEF
jgi:secreted Zn-dependent insulinase-like peptidase